MSDAPSTTGTRKLRIWLGIAMVCIPALLLVAVLFALWQGNQAEVARQLAEIGVSGEPVQIDELEAFYARPLDPNATKLWLDALSSLALPAFGQAAGKVPILGTTAEIPPPGEPWSDRAASEKLLAQYQSSLDLLHQASAGGEAARYPISFKNGFAMPLPHLLHLRQASRLLALEAHVNAHRGDAHAVAQSIEACLAVGESLRNEPILMSQLVRMGCDGGARSHLLKLLPQVSFAGEDLLRLQERLSAVDYRDGLHRALLGERAIGSIALTDPQQLTPVGGLPQGIDYLLPLFGAAAHQVYLEHMRQTLVASDLPWPQAVAEAGRIESALTANREAAAIVSRLKFLLTRMIAASIETSFKAAARNSGQNDALIAALAIERYRRQHDKLPQRLDQLVPDFLKTIPLDPFNSQPLQYVPGETGYILYGVGEDGVDNGGVGDDSGQPDDVLRIDYPAAMDASPPPRD